MIVHFEDVIENHYNRGHKKLPAFRPASAEEAKL